MGKYEDFTYDVSDLVGLTVHSVKQEDDEIHFLLEDGRLAHFFHVQDCCEDVHVDDVNGDWMDICGVPLLVAEERTESGDEGDYGGTYTWTFYTFRTIKGSVDVKWHGSSNGYYSERVDFQMRRVPEGMV